MLHALEAHVVGGKHLTLVNALLAVHVQHLCVCDTTCGQAQALLKASVPQSIRVRARLRMRANELFSDGECPQCMHIRAQILKVAS